MVRVVSVVLLCLVFLGLCTLPQAQQYLSEGTAFSFDERPSIDYALVIDKSGSMRVGNRFLEAQTAASEFANQLSQGDRAAVIAFDSRAHLYESFTSDSQVLTQAIEGMVIGDWTQYQAGLYRALEEFETRTTNGQGIIVFMSDGRPDDDPRVLEQAVSDVLAADLCIYTIAYADEADEQAQAVLEDIALQSVEATGCGGYFRAEEGTYDLQRIYTQIYDETASQNVFDVSVEVSTEPVVELVVSAASTINSRQVIGEACFVPEIEIVVVRDDELVFNQRSEEARAEMVLERGVYEYFVTVRETCAGACGFSGFAQGVFEVTQGDAVCSASYPQIASIIRSQEPASVQITPQGLEPVDVVTDGVVIFSNQQAQPVVVSSAGGGFFESPPIASGGQWEYAFSRGLFNYEVNGLSGSIRSNPQSRPTLVGGDFVFVIDVSGSMAGEQIVLTREVLSDVFSRLGPQDRAALLSFSTRAAVLSQLTTDVGGLRSRAQSLRASGATNYALALREVPALLRGGRNPHQSVIFVSDGVPTDPGGVDEVMDVLRASLGSACLYTIGYGDEGVLAVGALERMAAYSQAVNGCGLFYYASANKRYLSQVLGEVFSLGQDPDLEFFDVVVSRSSSNGFELSARVRSVHNGVSVPSSGSACIPPADVSFIVDGSRVPLRYQQGVYSGRVGSSFEEAEGVLVASFTNPSNPVQVLVGSTTLVVEDSSSRWWPWVLAAVLLLFAAKVFMGVRRGRKL